MFGTQKKTPLKSEPLARADRSRVGWLNFTCMSLTKLSKADTFVRWTVKTGP